MGTSMSITNRPNNTYIGKGVVRASPAGLKLPKHRPWYRDVRRDMGRLIAMGIDMKLFRDHAHRKPEAKDTAKLDAIGLKHLATAFFIMAGLHAVSTAIFCSEVARGRRERAAKAAEKRLAQLPRTVPMDVRRKDILVGKKRVRQANTAS